MFTRSAFTLAHEMLTNEARTAHADIKKAEFMSHAYTYALGYASVLAEARAMLRLSDFSFDRFPSAARPHTGADLMALIADKVAAANTELYHLDQCANSDHESFYDAEGRMHAWERVEQIIHAAAKELGEPTPVSPGMSDNVPGLTSTK